jgi:hypothetical protein
MQSLFSDGALPQWFTSTWRTAEAASIFRKRCRKASPRSLASIALFQGSVMTWDDLKMHRRIFSSRANPPSRVARSRLLDYTRRTIMKPE